MKQVYYPYHLWEDYINGMWRKVSVDEEKVFLQKAIEFTGDHILYGSFMEKVVDTWPISCEHNLTDLSQNRKAWIGHAACLLGINCPEYITRQAWGYLTRDQQDLANGVADKAILRWEKTKGFKRGLYAKELFDC